MLVQQFIRAIIEEREGFILDDAWRLSEESLNVIVPIKRDLQEERDYITLAEANDVKIEDTGQIDHVYVKNNEKKPLYISRGEIFRGKTQERAAIHGYMVMPDSGARIAVRCIHQTKGINSGAEMKYGGKTPSFVDLSNQHNTWNSVRTYYSSHYGDSGSLQEPLLRTWNNTRGSDVIYATCSTSPDTQDSKSSYTVSGEPILGSSEEVSQSIPASDDLVNTLDDISSMIKEMMKKIPPIENQVGAIFINENQVKGMDVYNLPDSWKAVKDDTIAKEGSEFLKKEDNNIFEFKPEKVKALIGTKLNTKFEEKEIFSNKDCKIIEFREIIDDSKKERFLGEAVEFLGKIIHLTMYRK